MTVLWQIILAVGFTAGLVFITAYGYKARRLWWRTALGWHLMGMTCSLTAALGLMLYGSVFGPLERHVWLLVVGAVVLLLVQRTWLVLTMDQHPHQGTGTSPTTRIVEPSK